MAADRSDPRKQRFPSLRGIVMVDTFRGRMRVRAWPRKTGTPKSKTVRTLNTLFKSANQMAKKLVPRQQVLAIAQAKGTGLYPRDLLFKSIYGGMFDMATEDGRLIQQRVFQVRDVMFQGAIVELTTPQTLPAGANTTIVWPLPVLDTAGFWNVTEPTRLTIPVGIDVVELTYGWGANAATGFQKTLIRLGLNGTLITRDANSDQNQPGQTGGRGAIPVVPGDFFELTIFVNKLTNADIGHRTFLTLNVLGAS